VVRTMSPAQASSPEGGSKDHHRQEEEDTCYLKPEDSAYATEWAQKTANSMSDSTGGPSGDVTGGLAPCTRLSGSAPCRDRRVGCSLGACRYALAGDASRNAETDTKSAADGLRLHFDSMVTARLLVRLCTEARWFTGCSKPALELR
jgi:hypothetical protein